MIARIQSKAAAAMLGVTPRQVQLLAARCELPAIKIGSIWTFDIKQIELFIRQKETKPCQILLKEAKPIGFARLSTDAKLDSRYEQAISELRGKRRLNS